MIAWKGELMFRAVPTLRRYEARAAHGAVYELIGASFEDAALTFADCVHAAEPEVELTDCETGERRRYLLDFG